MLLTRVFGSKLFRIFFKLIFHTGVDLLALDFFAAFSKGPAAGDQLEYYTT